MSQSIEPLTDRQREVLTFIESQIGQLGYPPTIREIGRHLGMRSTNGVNDHLKALERKGYIKREGNKSRTLRVVVSARGEQTGLNLVTSEQQAPLPDNVISLDWASKDGAREDDMIDVPLLGRVAAGAPILAEQDAEDTVRVSSFFLGRGAHSQKTFALRVVGESMIEDGIHDGDFLFVKKQPTARAGEIVVVMIDGEATCKRFYPEGDRIRLQPANSAMEPIFVHKSEFKQTDILGIVVGVYRKY
jgi:repressor LexA